MNLITSVFMIYRLALSDGKCGFNLCFQEKKVNIAYITVTGAETAMCLGQVSCHLGHSVVCILHLSVTSSLCRE